MFLHVLCIQASFDIVGQSSTLRRKKEDIVLYKAIGVGLEDVVLAKHILKKRHRNKDFEAGGGHLTCRLNAIRIMMCRSTFTYISPIRIEEELSCAYPISKCAMLCSWRAR